MSLPPFAAWRHVEAKEGFEVVFFAGLTVHGHTTAVEEGEPYAVRYAIELDERRHTRTAQVWGQSRTGTYSVVLEADGAGRWRIDGEPAPHLDGVFDVDLESSALTNAFPVARLALAVGEEADAPAAYVRALDLRVERLEQHYTRVGERRYAYAAPAFDTYCELVYDEFGLVLDYPGIAQRVG